jgi:hypothetical protein
MAGFMAELGLEKRHNVQREALQDLSKWVVPPFNAHFETSSPLGG